MADLKKIAELVDQMIADDLDLPQFEFPHRLYAGDDTHATLIGKNDDPYELMESVTKPANIEAGVLVACGWATKASDDGDFNPRKRVRVRITTSFRDGEHYTIARMEENPTEVMDMGSSGEGPLSEALDEWWNS